MKKPDTPFAPDASLLHGSTFHDNVTQVYIRTTEDKLRNCAREFQDAYTVVFSWNVPLGLVCAFGTSLLTNKFEPALGQTGEFWHALFVIVFVVSALWLTWAVGRAIVRRKDASIESLINRIKTGDDPWKIRD